MRITEVNKTSLWYRSENIDSYGNKYTHHIEYNATKLANYFFNNEFLDVRAGYDEIGAKSYIADFGYSNSMFYYLIDPNWPEVNKYLKDFLLESTVLYVIHINIWVLDYTLKKLIDGASSWKIMGKTNLEDARAMCTDETHKWNYEFRMENIAGWYNSTSKQVLYNFTKFFVKLEVNYSENGVLESIKYLKEEEFVLEDYKKNSKNELTFILEKQTGGLITGFEIISALFLLQILAFFALKKENKSLE